MKILNMSSNSPNHGIKKTRYDRCLRPPSRIEPSMRVKFESTRLYTTHKLYGFKT